MRRSAYAQGLGCFENVMVAVSTGPGSHEQWTEEGRFRGYFLQTPKARFFQFCLGDLSFRCSRNASDLSREPAGSVSPDPGVYSFSIWPVTATPGLQVSPPGPREPQLLVSSTQGSCNRTSCISLCTCLPDLFSGSVQLMNSYFFPTDSSSLPSAEGLVNFPILLGCSDLTVPLHLLSHGNSSVIVPGCPVFHIAAPRTLLSPSAPAQMSLSTNPVVR